MKKSTHDDVLVIAAYDDLADARTDFNELDRRAEKGVEIRSAALVTKNADGEPEVVEASNRHGGSAIVLGAGMGLLFGLFVAPLGISLVVGAAAGGMAAAFAEHELRSGLRHEVAAALENGTGVIVAWVYPGGYEAVLTAVESAGNVKELPVDKQTVKSLDDAVAAAVAELGHHTEINAGTPDTKS
jgi:uncharacterized membrane protein